MKRLHFVKALLMTFALLCISTVMFAQRSHDTSSTGTINGANVTIKYGTPVVKGREGKIYGTNLVPYDGKVWRAGANNATVIETDKDLTVEGKKLPAGKYSIYIIASAKDWEIIFNSKTGQWGINRDGSTTLDPALDVIRVTVTPKKSAAMSENLAYKINNNGIVLSWENLDVPIRIK
jgi:hypothetical protein